jgi:hypothetical protein
MTTKKDKVEVDIVDMLASQMVKQMDATVSVTASAIAELDAKFNDKKHRTDMAWEASLYRTLELNCRMKAELAEWINKQPMPDAEA